MHNSVRVAASCCSMGEAEAQNEHRHRLQAWDASLDCAARNLAASRKLSREVEQTLRKVREGLSLFAEFWNKTVQAPVRAPVGRARAGSRARAAKRLCTKKGPSSLTLCCH